MLHSPKLAILQSLDAMDQQQMDEVLVYIKDVLKQNRTSNPKDFKREALKEIRQALRSAKKTGFSLAV
jgi:hypothetical protein